jgi:predicted transcriptional regulator of viral defense system
MSIKDKIYKFIISKNVVSVEELTSFGQNELGENYKYIYKKYIYPFLKTGRVRRVRRGMYSAVNIYSENEQKADRYLIASKVRPNYYLGYHTALELHGCAYSAFWEVSIIIYRTDYFQPFNSEGVKYQPVTKSDLETEIMIMKYRNHEIKVTSPARTIVDCLDRLDLTGGLEECIKSLDGLRGVDIEGIENVLDLYHNNLLLRSVGVILEKLIEQSPFYSHISIEDLEKLQERVGKAPMYLDQRTESEYNKKWNLYVPVNLDDLIRGV